MVSTATGLLFCLLCLVSASGQVAFESVPDLEKSMYKIIDGYPCVRLLNLSGEIGCANPGLDKVVAPIVKFKNDIELVQSSSLLVASHDFDSFLSRVSSDSNFARHVSGVLVESGLQNQTHLKGSSPDKKFPQAEFSPYQNSKFEWNPTGSGIMWGLYDFPVFLLSESSTQSLQEIAVKNENKDTYAAEVTEFDLVMQTTKAGTHNSESCLGERTCLPLGGYSVWSALPTENISSSISKKPIILTVASMDSASFFRDKSLGAESPLSGMISLLAAVDALSRVEGLDKLSKQLVFVIFTGEAWGYLGSRRFLLELDQHTDAVNGINNTLIETVIEIGSVGKGYDDQGVKTFYAHTAGVSSATNKTLSAIKKARDSLGTKSIKYSTASESNPGIPPSSFMSFLNQNPHTPGVVLEDFDTSFTNKFYHSHLDDLSNINSSAIVAAASLVARTLYILATNNTDLTDSSLNSVKVNSTLVDELLGCLLNCEPGLSCELVTRYISPSSTCPSHYVGVIQGDPAEPFVGYVGNVSRFVWNFMADKTSGPLNNVGPCSDNCSRTGGVCIKQEIDGKGVCVISTTRYVPAYSTRLKYESDGWTILPPNSSDPMGIADPVWTESNWKTISLRVYSLQGAAYDRLILVAGVSVTGLSYLLIIIIKTTIAKALKQD